ncbi:MAG: AI-2E family transporter [Gemmatimonadota bacterium]|nr:MAG: AI-2E family transporter [Gemmatimonadota bacterium]
MDKPTVQERFSRNFLLLLVAAISLLFFVMIRRFAMDLLVAAIFAGLSHPLYRRLITLFRGREVAASLATLAIVLLVIVVPLIGFLGIVAAQAVEVSQSVAPWVERQIDQPQELDRLLSGLPFWDRIQPYQDQIITKVGQFAGNVGTFLLSRLAAVTRGTAEFFFDLFVVLYAMFFFLKDGRLLLKKILYYMPLGPTEENQMVARFTSVARATIKGTLVIGIVQGTLGGLAFLVAGVPGWAFWGTIMAVLSIIPGVGTALVWIPGCIYLAATGEVMAAILLAIWSIAVVGTADNVLRPVLVGRDTKMPDLLVLVSTLGGLLLFGAVGIVIGPIVAALFVTVWDIYGEAFSELLPVVPDTGMHKALAGKE